MAKVISKQLGELLQEKQEPFLLDIYLLEKGCLRNSVNLDPSAHCCLVNPKGPLWRSLSLGVNKRSKHFPNYSKVFKAVFEKLILVSNRQKGKKCYSSNEEAANSSSSFAENATETRPTSLQKKEIETKKKLQHRYKEDKKQLRVSLVSVLNEAPSFDGSIHGNNTHETGKQSTRTRDSILAVPCSKFTLMQPDAPNNTNFPSQNQSTKKSLLQSKQLLIDCVRELIASSKWKLMRENNLLKFLGPEEIGKLLCDDVRACSKLSGNESNITQLLNVDYGASIKEWRDFEPQMTEISVEIGDSILEDISKEIVAEMVHLLDHIKGHTSSTYDCHQLCSMPFWRLSQPAIL